MSARCWQKPRWSPADALYGVGIRAYAAAVRLAARRNPKARLMVEGHRRVWDELAKLDPTRPTLWLHAASLGEFEQGRPVMERIRAEHPQMQILLTFFSPSGYEVRSRYEGADVVCYLPFDTPANARRFVETVRPAMAIFVKYEFWRCYLGALRRAGVPTYLISAIFRADQLFFKPWGGAYRKLLRSYEGIFVQDEGSRALLGSIGVESIVAGDTRFDRVAQIAATRKPTPELGAFLSAPHALTFVAGSSWPADESVYIPWLNAHPDVKAIIAPHEFDDARLKELRRSIAGGAILLSELRGNPEAGADAQAVIIDCFGLLSSLYAYADMAYVGGGFGTGIHNINEAAVYGVPVLFGPRHSKFLEARELIEARGGVEVCDGASFAREADALLADAGLRERRGRAAGAYIERKRGATETIMASLFPSSAG